MPDVVVIGGGAVGLATACELRRCGRSVTLIERGQPGRAASWASAGIVRAPNGDGPTDRLSILSYRLWPEFAERLRAESGLDPEFRLTGCLVPAFDDDQAATLRQTVRDGLIDQGTWLEGADLKAAEPSLGPAVVGAVWHPGGNVENRRLCKALEIAARAIGVEIRGGTEVRAILSQGDRVSGVALAHGTIHAEQVVVAAGAWSGALAGCEPPIPVTPQRGQILALDRGDVVLRHTFLNPDDPYLVPRANGRIIVGATREFAGWDSSITASGVAWLLTSAIHVIPALAACAIHEIWTGFRPLSPDGMPIIGQASLTGLFIASGHGPSGIGPLPGSVALLASLLLGEEPPVSAEAFSPLRFR